VQTRQDEKYVLWLDHFTLRVYILHAQNGDGLESVKTTQNNENGRQNRSKEQVKEETACSFFFLFLQEKKKENSLLI
jgi:hypothetical protein